MARIVWSPEALTRLNAVHDYIAQHDPAAAAGLTARLFDAGESLKVIPARGRPASNGTRELAIVPPYVIRYDHDGDVVRILGIRHGRQLG